MKFSPIENVKLYAGLKTTQNWQYIVGLKVAGVKVLVPWTSLHNLFIPEVNFKPKAAKTEEMKVQEQIWKIVKQCLVTACFFGGCYVYQCWLVKQREKEIAAWISETAPVLYKR
jgi:hypothetical protein